MYDDGMPKRRVTITIEMDLLEEAQAAVSNGQCRSLSQWIEGAISDQLDKEQRLALLGELIAEYEAEHGVITEEEMEERIRRDKEASATFRASAQARMAALQAERP